MQHYTFQVSVKKIFSILLLLLFTLLFFSSTLFSQVDTAKQAEIKPKIIFKNEPVSDSLNTILQGADSAKPKIIFNKNEAFQAGRIEMFSSEQFIVNGVTYIIGDDGINLKSAMTDNPEAVKMVESAYNRRSTGTALMIAGGAIAIAGYILPSTWVKLDEDKHQTYVQTWYWFPGVTAGVIVGGIGYVQHSSLTGRIRDAIDYYNQSLLKNNPDDK